MQPQQVFTPQGQQTPQQPMQQEPFQPQTFTPPPAGVPQQPGPPQPAQPQKPKSKKGLVIAIFVGVIIAFALLAGALLISSSGKKQTPQPAASTSSEEQIFEPAQGIDLEQTGNSLSQDLSSLDDDKDLPANSLDDSTLGL